MQFNFIVFAHVRIGIKHEISLILILTTDILVLWHPYYSIYFIPLIFLDELYGDFEDLETGEVHKAKAGNKDQAEVLKSN